MTSFILPDSAGSPTPEVTSSTPGAAGGGLGDRAVPARPSANWELLLQSVFIPLLCGVGVVGNALNIFVLTRQRMRRSARLSDRPVHVGLVGLAVSDMAVCLLMLPRAFVPEHGVAFDVHRVTLKFYYQMYSTGVITTFSLISTWLIVVTAGMRYVSTFHPLQWHLGGACGTQSTTTGGWCTGGGGGSGSGSGVRSMCCRVASRVNGGCALVVAVYVVCSLGNLPAFFEYSTMVIPADTGDVGSIAASTNASSAATATVAQPSLASNATTSDQTRIVMDLGMFNHATRAGFAFHLSKSIVGFIIPGLLLTFFNIRLIQALRMSERMRRASCGADAGSSCSGGGGTAAGVVAANTATTAAGPGLVVRGRWAASRNRLNVTLVAVVVMLICLVYPSVLLNFLLYLTPINKSVLNSEAIILTRQVLNVMWMANFALNFFLYCTLNAQFRRAFVDWFCGRHRRRGKRRDYQRVCRTPATNPARRDAVGCRAGADDVRMTQIRCGGSGGGGAGGGGSGAGLRVFGSAPAASPIEVPGPKMPGRASGAASSGRKHSGSRPSHSGNARSSMN